MGCIVMRVRRSSQGSIERRKGELERAQREGARDRVGRGIVGEVEHDGERREDFGMMSIMTPEWLWRGSRRRRCMC